MNDTAKNGAEIKFVDSNETSRDCRAESSCEDSSALIWILSLKLLMLCEFPQTAVGVLLLLLTNHGRAGRLASCIDDNLIIKRLWKISVASWVGWGGGGGGVWCWWSDGLMVWSHHREGCARPTSQSDIDWSRVRSSRWASNAQIYWSLSALVLPTIEMELSIRTSTVIQIITFTLLASISEALINSPAYYIQTDEGPNRFFQFSSGPGGGRCSAPSL